MDLNREIKEVNRKLEQLKRMRQGTSVPGKYDAEIHQKEDRFFDLMLSQFDERIAEIQEAKKRYIAEFKTGLAYRGKPGNVNPLPGGRSRFLGN